MRRGLITLSSNRRHVVLAGIVAALSVAHGNQALGQWPQFGGPKRDFVSAAKGLASTWPKSGPKRIWSRGLGEGYSSIAMDGGLLFTMYQVAGEEIVVALSADSGKTVWEHKVKAKVPEGVETRFGTAPRSTPTVSGDNVYTLGFHGLLTCLNKATGEVVWSYNLMSRFHAKPPEFGFSSSPAVYKGNLIVAVGGEGCGLMAFDLGTGKVAWRKHDFENLYSSPIVINVGGEDQIVLLTDREIVGVSAKDGELRWRHPHVNQWKTNIITPLWGDDGLLYFASGGEAGSRALKLTRDGEKTEAKEVWANRKMRSGHGNAVRVGDTIFGVGGYQNAATISAINAATGKIAWQVKEKGYSAGTLVYGDGKLILLKDDGTLALMNPSPKKLDVLAKVRLLKDTAWAMPILVGKRLYVRDSEKIMALDLG